MRRWCQRALQLGQRGVCFKPAACGDVGQATLGVVDQQQMDAFALQAVVVVQSVRVGESALMHTQATSSALVATPTLLFQIFAILGRQSTPKELVFLRGPGSGF